MADGGRGRQPRTSGKHAGWRMNVRTPSSETKQDDREIAFVKRLKWALITENPPQPSSFAVGFQVVPIVISMAVSIEIGTSLAKNLLYVEMEFV
ncbi:hypothetical protein L1887_36226 [Cichorium endivia]|nr:hypothetical protein L1887_36226 [Cichorium endivia]